MKLIFIGTAAEQTKFKQSIKINADDTAIIYTQQILDKPEDMTSGEQFLSMFEWRIEDAKRN